MWEHPVDREDASPELKALGRAWLADMCSGENENPLPAWAEAIFLAFEAKNPGFVRAECMTPEWRAERRAAFKAADDRERVARDRRRHQICSALISRDWTEVIALRMNKDELPADAEIGSDLWKSVCAARREIIWGRGDFAVRTKK